MQAKDEAYSNRFDLWLIILFALNIFDLIFSYGGLKTGFIEEANPIMAYLYDTSISAFLLFKIWVPSFMIIAVSLLLKFCENIRFIIVLVHIAIFIYGAINAYHIWWVYRITFTCMIDCYIIK